MDDENGNYKLIYKSNVHNVSAVLPNNEDVNWQRTTSFHEKLSGAAEFKKDMVKKLSTTQRLFNRNDKFMPKTQAKKQTSKIFTRLSTKEPVDPEKDEMYQVRKKELKLKAQERK